MFLILQSFCLTGLLKLDQKVKQQLWETSNSRQTKGLDFLTARKLTECIHRPEIQEWSIMFCTPSRLHLQMYLKHCSAHLGYSWMPCTCHDKVRDTLPCSWERWWCQCHHNHPDTSRFLLYLHSAERTRHTQVCTASAHCLSPAPDSAVFHLMCLKPAWNALKLYWRKHIVNLACCWNGPLTRQPRVVLRKVFRLKHVGWMRDG